MKLLSIEKGSPVAILFVYTSLATITSSKANVENITQKHGKSIKQILIAF